MVCFSLLMVNHLVFEDDLKNTQQYKVYLPTDNELLSCTAENKKHKQQ